MATPSPDDRSEMPEEDGFDTFTGVLVPAVVLLSLIAFTPVVNYAAWSPKAALVPLILAAGLPLLVLRAARADRVAQAGVVFGLVAIVSAVFAVNHTTAVFGLYGWGTGALFVLALPSAWAIGRQAVDVRSRRRIELAVLVAVGLNLAVVFLQSAFDLDWARLELAEGRATGLMGGPVSLSALLTGAAGLAAARHRGRLVGLIWPVALGAGLQLCGSRVALVGAFLIAVAALRKRRNHAALFALALVLGVLVGGPVAGLRGGETGTSRLQEAATTGSGARLENWSIALRAFADRPVVGTGPGTYAAATTELRTPALARAEGPDRLFADAHNLVVEYAVTTGFVGLLSLLGFGALAVRHVRERPLLWLAAGLLVVHAVQPQHVTLTPLLFLGVGASMAPLERPILLPRLGMALLLAPAAVLAGLLLYGDHLLRQSDLDFTQDQAATAIQILPRWKEPASLQARNVLYEAIVRRSRERFETSREWRREAARREPTDPSVWGKLADMDMRLAEPEKAAAHFRRGLEANPVSVSLRIGLIEALATLGRRDEAVAVLFEARDLNPDPEQRETLDDLARALDVG